MMGEKVRRRWLLTLGSIIMVLSLLAPQIVPSQRTRGMEEKNTKLDYAKIEIVSNGKVIRTMNISMERAEEIKQSLEDIKRKIKSSKDLMERMNLFEQALGILRENDILPPDFTLENIKEGIKHAAPYLLRDSTFPSAERSSHREEACSSSLVESPRIGAFGFGEPFIGIGSITFVGTLLGQFFPLGINPQITPRWNETFDLRKVGLKTNVSAFLTRAIFPSGEFLVGNAVSLCIVGGMGYPMFKYFVGNFVYLGVPVIGDGFTIYLEIPRNRMHIILADAALLLALFTIVLPLGFSPT